MQSDSLRGKREVEFPEMSVSMAALSRAEGPGGFLEQDFW